MNDDNPQSREQSPITVLLVDDSPIALSILSRILSASPLIRVIGTARNGMEALDLIGVLKPQVVCLDYHMPLMNGLELTKAIMSRSPRPILVISETTESADSQKAFELLEAGAVDVLRKPNNVMDKDALQVYGCELMSKIKVVSRVHLFSRQAATKITPPVVSMKTAPSEVTQEETVVEVIAIGASTGGPQAIETVLVNMPARLSVPILCVQHISDGFLPGFVSWLGVQCRRKVKVAEHGEWPLPGIVYFPPERLHLEVDSGGWLRLSHAPPVNGHRPSVTHLFKSVAKRFGNKAVGVLLTGMGDDGAEGLVTMRRAGGRTFVQNENSCVVFGMPRVAIEKGGAQWILPPDQIASRIAVLCQCPEKPGKGMGASNVDVSGAPPPWAGPVVKVLMVDDDQTMFLLVDRALSHHPEIQITYCNDIKEALAKARKLKPAIILQDLNMPGGDCLELLSQYRKDPVTRATPVIILSGTEDNDVKHKALALGANDYMVKSPNVQNIVDHVCHFAMS
ncbi:MAG: chemotaxis-specific protein-glutamate methyltransferase CheB [bacterium]